MERKDNNGDPGKGFRVMLGIFMVIVYLAVGLLFIFNVFSLWDRAVSASVGGLLCLYAVYRGFRVFKENNKQQ